MYDLYTPSDRYDEEVVKLKKNIGEIDDNKEFVSRTIIVVFQSSVPIISPGICLVLGFLEFEKRVLVYYSKLKILFAIDIFFKEKERKRKMPATHGEIGRREEDSTWS